MIAAVRPTRQLIAIANPAKMTMAATRRFIQIRSLGSLRRCGLISGLLVSGRLFSALASARLPAGPWRSGGGAGGASAGSIPAGGASARSIPAGWASAILPLAGWRPAIWASPSAPVLAKSRGPLRSDRAARELVPSAGLG
jgi:hypothetical protein